MFTTPHHDIGYHFELSDDEEKFDEGIIQCLNSEIVKLNFCNKVELKNKSLEIYQIHN